MNRKLRVLMLSLFAVMFAVSSAFAAIEEGNLTLTRGDDNPGTVYGGLGFEGTYTLENNNEETRLDDDGVEVDWTIAVYTTGDEPKNVTDQFNFYVTGTTVDEETGTMTMNFGLGVPNNEVDGGVDYTYTVTATVKQTGVDDDVTKSDENVALNVTPSNFSAFMDLITYEPESAVTPTITSGEEQFVAAGPDYSVTLTFNPDQDGTTPLLMVETDAEKNIDANLVNMSIPGWMKYTVDEIYSDTDNDEYYVKTLTISFASDDNNYNPAQDNNIGYINIYGAGVNADVTGNPVIFWAVMYVEPALSFDVVKASADITVVAGSSDVAVFTLVSKDGYCTSLDLASSDVSSASGFTFTITSSDNASGDTFVNINVEVSSDVVAGDYSFDVVLYSIQGVSADATLYVTVLSADFTVSYDVSTDVLALSAGESTDIYIPVFGAVAPLTLTGLPDGYVATFVEMSGDYAVFKIFVPEGVEAGSYSADVTITDAYGRSQKFTLAWTVGANVLTISEDKTVAVSVAYGSSADVTFTYYGAEVANAIWSSDIEFTDYVSLDVAWSGISGDTGTITVTVIPLVAVADSYNTAIYFYDANSNDVSIDLTVNVTVPAISLSTSTVGLSARVGSTDQVSITHSNAEPVSMKMSPDVPAAYGFAMVSSDELNTFTLSITPTALVSPDYRGRFVVTDEYGNVASASVTLHTVASADAFTITPDDSTVTLMAGSSTLVSLVASNNSGLVTWSYGKTSADITVSSSDNAGATQDNVRGTFRVAAAITASGDYRVPFTARDAAGHSKTATITVKVTGLSKTVQDLINSGYVVVENGRLVLTNAAFQSGSAPTAALVGNFYEYILMLNFNVTSWRLYLNDTRVAISAADGVSAAAGEEATITPDADDPKVALGSINRTTLTEGTSYNVELGVIPEGGTEEIRGSLGTITGGTSMVGVGSASGGCDAGLGMLVSALAAAFFIGRKRS